MENGFFFSQKMEKFHRNEKIHGNEKIHRNEKKNLTMCLLKHSIQKQWFFNHISWYINKEKEKN